MKLIPILDAGHGIETAGKRSPLWSDGKQLFEYKFNRAVTARIAIKLGALEIPYTILAPEINDISLKERVRRANKIYQQTNRSAYLVSIHANAGGGTGWECFTSVGETKSDELATIFCEESKTAFPTRRMRFDHTDGDPDKESQFYILRNTHCPAVLTENFFMDYEPDCRFILSDEGVEAVANMHVAAIKRIYNL